MDRYRIQTTLKKTWKNLASPKSKELLVFLFFLALSAVFWILQTLDETLEKEVSIPIELTDVPQDVVIITPLPEKVKVRVRDKGTSLIHYLRYDISPIRISFPVYENSMSNGRVRLPNADVQKMVQERLLSTSKIQTLSPDTLEFYFNHGMHRSVPVKVVGNIDVSPEYYLQDVTTSPAEVVVYASAGILDTLSCVQTMLVSMEGLTGNTSKEVGLRTIKGVKYDLEKVKVNALVDVYVENTLEIPVLASNFPAEKSLRTFPANVQVTYTIGYSQNKKINPEDFLILLTYEQILGYQKEGRSKIPLSLRSKPEEVTNVRIEPQEVDYLVETTGETE